MKILLVGEYSGVHTDLAVALRSLGHEVITCHAGDDFKNYPRDFDLKPVGSHFLFRRLDMIRKYRKFLQLINKTRFDVIQFINPGIFPRGIDKLIYNNVFKTSSKIFFLSAGEDHVIWNAYRSGAYRYYAFDGMRQIDRAAKKNLWDSAYIINLSNKVLKNANAIIPLCVEYKIAYEKYFSRTPFIPLSINPAVISQNIESKDYGRIKILHGINRGREGYKGSNYILPALEMIKEKYQDKVDVIISENLPFSEYLKLLFEVNIVVDQALCYSVSMNALYAMLSGCVVMGGCEKEYLDSLSITEAPLINILPDTEDIFNKIESLIHSPQVIKKLGRQAHSFVLNHHSITSNVNKFIDVWQKY